MHPAAVAAIAAANAAAAAAAHAAIPNRRLVGGGSQQSSQADLRAVGGRLTSEASFKSLPERGSIFSGVILSTEEDQKLRLEAADLRRMNMELLSQKKIMAKIAWDARGEPRRQEEEKLRSKGERELQLKNASDQREREQKAQQKRQEDLRLRRDREFRSAQESRERQMEDEIRKRVVEQEQHRQQVLAKRDEVYEKRKADLSPRLQLAPAPAVSSSRTGLHSPRPSADGSPLSAKMSPRMCWAAKMASERERSEDFKMHEELLRARAEHEHLILQEKEARAKESARRQQMEELRMKKNAEALAATRYQRDDKKQQELQKREADRVRREQVAERKKVMMEQKREQDRATELEEHRKRDRAVFARENAAQRRKDSHLELKGQRESLLKQASDLRRREEMLGQQQKSLARDAQEARRKVQREVLENDKNDFKTRRVLEIEEKQFKAEAQRLARDERRRIEEELTSFQQGSPRYFHNLSPRSAEEAKVNTGLLKSGSVSNGLHQDSIGSGAMAVELSI